MGLFLRAEICCASVLFWIPTKGCSYVLAEKNTLIYNHLILISCFLGLNQKQAFGGSLWTCVTGCTLGPVPTPNNMISSQTAMQTILQTIE